MKKQKNEKESSIQSENNMEEEILKADDLLTVQGGIENKDVPPDCGLGCFTGGISSDLEQDEYKR